MRGIARGATSRFIRGADSLLALGLIHGTWGTWGRRRLELPEKTSAIADTVATNLASGEAYRSVRKSDGCLGGRCGCRLVSSSDFLSECFLL